MDKKIFGAIAACVAALAVVICCVAVAIEFPVPINIAMVAGAALLLLSAGGLIGAGIASQKKSTT